MPNKKKNKMDKDIITECSIDNECAKPVDLKECIDSARCDDPQFCVAYDELRQARLIARSLIKLRKGKDWTRAELAKAAGCSVSSIARLENPQDCRKNLALLMRAATALDAQLKLDILPNKKTSN
jgi:DNA-binding XRE family transcriptional regulator